MTATLVTNITAQVGAIDPNRPQMQHEHAQQHEVMQKYTCPMHPEVITDHPGNCPKCGMKLVPLKEKKRRTSNVRTLNVEHTLQPETHHVASVAPVRSNAPREMEMEMHSTIDLADPMSREGSGTSWLPDSSPMYGKMFMFGEDMLMLHGAIFPVIPT